jgi:hypothetical protein
MLTQYVFFSRKFNAHTISSDVINSLYSESLMFQLNLAIYFICVLKEYHRAEGISNTSNKVKHTGRR